MVQARLLAVQRDQDAAAAPGRQVPRARGAVVCNRQRRGAVRRQRGRAHAARTTISLIALAARPRAQSTVCLSYNTKPLQRHQLSVSCSYQPTDNLYIFNAPATPVHVTPAASNAAGRAARVRVADEDVQAGPGGGVPHARGAVLAERQHARAVGGDQRVVDAARVAGRRIALAAALRAMAAPAQRRKNRRLA